MKMKNLKKGFPEKLNQCLTEDQVSDHRFLNCPFYEQCLINVCGTYWQSFSCAKCENFFNREEINNQMKQNLEREDSTDMLCSNFERSIIVDPFHARKSYVDH